MQVFIFLRTLCHMAVFLSCCSIMLASLPADHLTPFLKRSSAHLGAWRWGSTKACERALQYRIGERIHGFTVNQVGLGAPLVSAQSRDVGGGLDHLCPQPRFLQFHSRCSKEQTLQVKGFPDSQMKADPLTPSLSA